MREIFRKLVVFYKENSYVSFEDIDERLPKEGFTAEQMDKLVAMLSDANITVKKKSEIAVDESAGDAAKP